MKTEGRRNAILEEIWDLARENERKIAAVNAQMETLVRKIEKADEKVEYAKNDIAGITNSNGLAAEYYFYNSLMDSLSFGKMQFDYGSSGVKRDRKLPNGEKIRGQYDVILVSDKNVGLVEVKYKVEKNDVVKLVEKQSKDFRRLFPEYNKHKLYLGIAGFSFDNFSEKEAALRGVAILKQKGDVVETLDGKLRAY